MLFRGVLGVFVFLSVVFLCEGRAEAMRCGSRLISPGDTASEVTARCGDPTQVVRTTETRYINVWYGNGYVQGGHAAQIQVEIWTYNRGPRRLMRQLRFENGVLVSERTLGYGH